MATSKATPIAPPKPPAPPAAPRAAAPPPKPPTRPAAPAKTESPFTEGFSLNADQVGPLDGEVQEAAQEEAPAPTPTAPPRRAPEPPRQAQMQQRPAAPPKLADTQASTQSTSIEPRATQTVTNARADVPEYLKRHIGNRAGTEEVEREDLTLPRLGLCQALTPQKKQSAGANHIPGLQDGQYFNSVTNDVYGTWVKVIPLFFYKTRIKFNPINEGGGIDCQSLNGKTGGHYSPSDCLACEFSQFVDNQPPKCNLFHNFLSLIVDSELMAFDDKPELIIVSFKSSALKISKQWNAQVRMTNLPMYAKLYEISSAEVTGNGNTWEQYVIKPGPYVDQSFFNAAENYFQAYRNQEVQIDTRGLDAEAEGDTSFNQAGM